MIVVEDLTSFEIESKKINTVRLQDLTSNFKKNGFLVIRNIFDKEFITLLNKHFLNNYKSFLSDNSQTQKTEFVKKRFIVTLDIKEEFNTPNLYANPILFQILNSLFADKIIISDFHCVTALPGASDMPIHKDGCIFDGNPLTPLLPPHAIGLLIPLIPFTKENGATKFWPGSHLNTTKQEHEYENDPNFYEAILDIGSCILMDYRLVHKANPNNSDEIRPLLYINYSAIWYFDFDTFKNQTPIIINDENFSKVPNEYKKLFLRRNIFK
jgi:ectoine hydroxylase-related dioxygenase (phytanoyl-CoA dioxygenase family)